MTELMTDDIFVITRQTQLHIEIIIINCKTIMAINLKLNINDKTELTSWVFSKATLSQNLIQ